jgi:hypothetical protein
MNVAKMLKVFLPGQRGITGAVDDHLEHVGPPHKILPWQALHCRGAAGD